MPSNHSKNSLPTSGEILPSFTPKMAGTSAPPSGHGEGVRIQDERARDASDARGCQRDGFAAPAQESEEPDGVGPGDGFAGHGARSGGCAGGGARGEGERVEGYQDGKSDAVGGGRRGDGRYVVRREVYCEGAFKARGAPQDEGCNGSDDWGKRSGRGKLEIAAEDTHMEQRNHQPSAHGTKTENETLAMFMPYRNNIESVAKVRARHVQRQYLREGTWEFLQTQTTEVILEVYFLTRDHHDKDHDGSPRYELLAESSLRILRDRSSEAVDLESLVPALRLCCREDSIRPDRHVRSCMARFLCCKRTLKKLWHHDDYMELMTDPDSAPGMAALLQVALLANL